MHAQEHVCGGHYGSLYHVVQTHVHLQGLYGAARPPRCTSRAWAALPPRCRACCPGEVVNVTDPHVGPVFEGAAPVHAVAVKQGQREVTAEGAAAGPCRCRFRSKTQFKVRLRG